MEGSSRRRGRLRARLVSVLVSSLFVVALAAPLPSVAAPPSSGERAGSDHGKAAWQKGKGVPAATHNGHKAAVKPRKTSTYRLDRGRIASMLGAAPRESSLAARRAPLILSLPTPAGIFQRFDLVDSPIMAAGLAVLHPEIKTYRGRGVDDPTATIRADLTPLGFHASVRSATGSWYIDPYYHLDDSLYASYYGRDLDPASSVPFVERDADGAELSVDHGYYHAADTVAVQGSGFAAGVAVALTISDPQEQFATRNVSAQADELGSFTAEFAADPAGHLDTHIVAADDGTASALGRYQVVSDDDTTMDPPTGDLLRTYRLALISDPGYADFFGGPANVTAAKVTLMNRVTQIYEDDLSIRMQLVANNDLLNLDTWAAATAPNGPCGAAACFTQSQVTGCSSTTRARFVIGQIIGASNYDIGHLALGQPGGGVANLGVVGRSNKAGGCTGIPTPVGDFYAVDYVAHEMGHQFSGNHPFNGNQLNCSGGNRSAATSVEPGSGSSIMAYAGICLTDDLQPHSDPYFSERSLQEISTYTTSSPAAINEVQTASLRHFGGGNEVQVVTFGPGYARTSTIQPLSVAIGAVPSATQLGGAEEVGNTVTISTGAAGSTHTLQVGDSVTIAGVGVAGYNGTFTVTAVLTSRAFQYANPVSGLARSGGGTVTLVAPGATESGTTVTIRTSTAHGRSVGDVVTIAGVGVGGYNGTFTISAVPTPRSFEYTALAAGLANSGGGTSTFFSPFRVRIGGADSVIVGGNGLAYTNANLTTAIAGIAGFAGTATVTGAASTGFAVTYTGASAGLDVPNIELVGLSCGGCFASVEETNHGGPNDAFTLDFGGNVSGPITNGGNYSAAGIVAALTPLLPAGGTVAVAGFANGAFTTTGFQMTFGGTLAATNVPVTVALGNFSAGASGFVGETDKGGAVDNKGGVVTPTGDAIPTVAAPAGFTIPLRTPFALTGSATDVDGDPLIYAWEQNDRGGGAGTSLLANTKTNGPLFAMFPKSGQISESATLLYDSPGENHLTTNPTRVLPDLQQIIDNNTNADTGACPTGPIAPPVSIAIKECFSEFLPTADYVGFAGTNQAPLSLHFRLTARDGRGGVNSADTTLLLAPTAGPFLVTSPNTIGSWTGGSTQTITWAVANTDLAPVSAANVKISLSEDGGLTYPDVLSASTPNDGSEAVTIPNIATTQARVKIEAIGNIFFDISNADFAVQAVPVVTNSLGGGSASVQYSDALSPAVTVTATDDDTEGSDLTAGAVGLPAGLSLTATSTSGAVVLPGTRTWTVAGNVTGAPGSYPVTVTVTDDVGGSGTTSFTIDVTREDADATYTGDMLAFTAPGGSTATVVLRATIRDSAVIPASGDTAGGDIRNATVTFKEGATSLCGPLTVALIDGATTTGTAACSKTFGLGAHDIDIFVNDYYTGGGVGIVEVAQPDGTFITGGGYRAVSGSAGTYKADTGSKVHFAFNVRYGKNLKNLQGHATVRFTKDGRRYEFKSTATDSLGIALKTPGGAACSGPPSSTCFGYADFRTKANLTDVTDPAHPIAITGGLALQITITDKGSPGSSDSIGMTVWNGNTLVFSSQWTGAKTSEGPVDGGNVVVH